MAHAPMPRLITFMLVRLSTGFAIGIVTALAIAQIGFPGVGLHSNLVAFGLFLYLFGSTMALGYLATALLLDEV